MTTQNASGKHHTTTLNRCDLYPIIPSAAQIAESLPHLEKIVPYDSVTAVRLCVSEPIKAAALTPLTDLLYQHDVALIIAPSQSDLLSSLPLDCVDGVHMPHSQDLKAIPTTYRKKKLSVQSGCSCHTLDDAMRAGELGADYVSFPATETTAISQWSLVIELPCVADNVTSVEQAQQARQAGADFLGVMLKLDGTDQETIASLNALLS